MDREHVVRAMTNLATKGVRTERKRTSGSTGRPVALAKDMEMAKWIDALMWAVYGWHGISPGDQHARFWGMPPAFAPRVKRVLTDRLLQRRRFNAFQLNQEDSIRFFAKLRGSRPRYVHGYPTLLRAFIEYCTDAGLDGTDLGVQVVFSTGELLAPQTRDLIATWFGSPVVNEYGCTESGLLSFDCEFGISHMLPIAAVPEVVDESGISVPSGQSGEVVVTDLYGRVFPLLRYRLGDRASLVAGRVCECGRQLPVFNLIGGRTDDFIQTPDRGPVYDAILAYSMPEGVQRFRAIQSAPDRLIVNVLPRRGSNGDSIATVVRTKLRRALGPTMRIDVSVTADIPFDDSGKLRYFVPLDPNPPEE